MASPDCNAAVPPPGQPDYWVGDGVSWITGGVSILTSNRATVGLGAELGGTGARYVSASLTERVQESADSGWLRCRGVVGT